MSKIDEIIEHNLKWCMQGNKKLIRKDIIQTKHQILKHLLAEMSEKLDSRYHSFLRDAHNSCRQEIITILKRELE